MSARLYRLVTRRAVVAGLPYHVLCHYAMLADEKGVIRGVKHRELIRHMRISERSLLDSNHELVRLGYLRWITTGAGCRNRYFVIEERALISRRRRIGAETELPKFFARATAMPKKLRGPEFLVGESGLVTGCGSDSDGRSFE